MAQGERHGPGDSDMRAVYVRVLLVEVAVIAALVWFGCQFS